MSDEIQEIRARHLRDDRWRNTQSNEDRAYLLAEVDRLRADLATQQGCCDGAAAQDAHIRREREEHRAEVEGLRAQLEDRYVAMRVRQLEEALDAERQTVRRLRATNKQLVTGIDNISRRNREEIERLREALQESACACSSIRECASEWAKDGKCPHLIARNALEGKP